jgi:hypothetical protein
MCFELCIGIDEVAIASTIDRVVGIDILFSVVSPVRFFACYSFFGKIPE